jgi:hypothetical protein
VSSALAEFHDFPCQFVAKDTRGSGGYPMMTVSVDSEISATNACCTNPEQSLARTRFRPGTVFVSYVSDIMVDGCAHVEVS